MFIWASEYLTLQMRVKELEGQVQLWSDRHTKALAHAQELSESLAEAKARADAAIDNMLQVKGLPPVTPTKPPSLEELSSLFEEDPAAVREIVKDIGERGAAEVLLDK